MSTIYEIKQRAQQLSEKTDSESISPAEVGGLFSDLADYANDVDVNGSSLGIRKTYTSVSAMEADKSPVGDDGNPLKKGQLVNIYNQDNPSSADNNKVFSWQNPGWQIRTTLDAGYATREELTELEGKSNSLNKRFNLINYDDLKIGKWYDNTGGEHISEDFCYVERLNVKPNTTYIFTGCLFTLASILEYDENNEIITAHYNNTEYTNPWYEMEFTTNVRCAYLKLASTILGATANKKNIGIGLYLSCESYINNLNLINNSVLNDILAGLLSNDGYYYDNTGAKNESPDFIAYDKVPVKGNNEYIFNGCIFSNCFILEYSQDDSLIKYHGDLSVGYENPTYSLKFKTDPKCSYIKFGTSKPDSAANKKNISPKLFAITNAYNSILEKNIVNLLESSDKEDGKWINNQGQLQLSNDFELYTKVLVSPYTTYRFTGCLFALASILEYDENDEIITAHYNNTEYTNPWYEMEFTTNVRCAYLKVPTVKRNRDINRLGVSASLVFVKEEDAFYIPKRTFFAKNLEKSMYYDRFGLSNDYIVSLNPSSRTAYGYPKQRRWSYTPSNTNSFNVNASVWYNQKLVANQNIVCEILEKRNPTERKNILWVADSISDYQNTAKFCKELFDGIGSGTPPTFVGTKHTSGTPDESYAGHDMYFFVYNKTYDGVTSPFWNTETNSLDFANYNKKLGIDKIHCCVIATGFNDAGGIIEGKYTLNEVYNAYKDFIVAITEANPGIKIVICLCPLESVWIRNRDTTQHTYWVNRIRLIEAELAIEYSSNVILSDAFYCIDAVNGYPTQEESIASVYASLNIKEKQTTDGTHPTELGCKEWGYATFPALLKSLS